MSKTSSTRSKVDELKRTMEAMDRAWRVAAAYLDEAEEMSKGAK